MPSWRGGATLAFRARRHGIMAPRLTPGAVRAQGPPPTGRTMHRREFLSLTASVVLSNLAEGERPATASPATDSSPRGDLRPQQILPSVWKLTLGKPERIIPVSARHHPPNVTALAA